MVSQVTGHDQLKRSGTSGAAKGNLNSSSSGSKSLGDPVVVCSDSPIGPMALACVESAGTTPLIITDVDERRLEFAKQFATGAQILTVERSQEQFAKDIQGLIQGMDSCCALECTESDSSIAGTIQTVGFGRKVFVIDIGKDETTEPFDAP